MELKYTHIHDSVESATMYLKGVIGKDVDSVQFVNELKHLEKLNVQNVEIRINSGGGSVVAGYDIVDALLTTPLNTTTYIAGMAASMAGVIAMAGKSIKMANYGILMVHSVNGISDEEVISKFNHSLVAIFNSRTNIDKSYLERLMNTETFFTAEEAFNAGFVDEIVVTKRIITEDVHNTSMEELMNIYNKINIENMEDNKELETEIVNAEEVTETSTEPDAEVEPETAPEEASEPVATEEPEAVAEAEPEESMESIKLKLEELVKVNEELTKKLAEQEMISNELLEKENNRLKAEKEAKELEVINSALEAGKITNEVKDTWMNFIQIDFEGAKKALESIVTNKVSVDIMDVVNKVVESKGIPTEKTFRELEKENPSELLRIKNETPEIFKEMYKNQYGVYPTL